MKKKTLAALATIGIAAAITSLSISPALAGEAGRSLVSGSSMYALSCQTSNVQLYGVDSTTANSTSIGAGAGDTDFTCAAQSAWDAANNTAYFTTFGETYSLYKIDPATGGFTRVAELNGDADYVNAIAISPTGQAYGIDDDTLYSLDLATGKLTKINDLTGEEDRGDIYGFAVNPTTGVFWTIDDDALVSTIDVTTGVLSEVGQAELPDEDSNNTYSLQVDSDGTLWVENDNYDNEDFAPGVARGMAPALDESEDRSELWSVDPSNGDAVESGLLNLDGTHYYSESLLLIPAVAITSAAPAASIVAGTPVSFTVTATGAGPITFSITAGALPTGLVLDPATGVISGTPTTPGTFTYTVTATNAAGSTTATYTQAITAHLPVVSG